MKSPSMSAGVLVLSSELLDEAYAPPSSQSAAVAVSYASPSSRSEYPSLSSSLSTLVPAVVTVGTVVPET